MTHISTKEAARRFFKVLEAAQKRPVIIDRHNRPRAVVVSMTRFRLYEKVLAHLSEEAAVAAMGEALEMARQGRLGLCNRARKDARLLAGIAPPARAKRAGKTLFDAGAGGGLEHAATDENSAPCGADSEK